MQVLADNVNLMAMNLTNQVRSIAEVTKAVANGDLKKKIEVDVRGEMLDLKVRSLLPPFTTTIIMKFSTAVAAAVSE